MRRRYIIIDENKTPKHSLDEPYTYDEIKDEMADDRDYQEEER